MIRWLTILVVATAWLLAADDAARTKLDESRAATSQGDYVRAIRSALEAEALYRKAGDRDGEARAANQAGLGHLYRAEYSDALAKFNHALAIDISTGDAESEVGIRNNIGNVHFFQGRYLDALEAYEAALERLNRSGSQPWTLRRRQLSLVNLGVLYEQLGQHDRALGYYKQANVEPTGLPAAEQGQLLSNLGTLYRRLKDPAGALETYREAQRWFERGKHQDGEINVLHNIGILFTIDYRDPDRGVAAFREALALARQTGSRRQEALGHLFLAEALYRRGEMARSGAEFQSALDGARKFSGVEEQWTALYGLGRIAEGQDRKPEALSSYRQAILAIESVRAGLRKLSLKSDFLANKRDVYDAAIALLLDKERPDAAELLPLIEQARARNLQDALPPAESVTLAATQSRLQPGELLVEYWMGQRGGAAIWLSRNRSGIARFALGPAETALISRAQSISERGSDWKPWSVSVGGLLLTGLPLDDARELIIVPDGALLRVPFEVLQSGPKALVRVLPIRYVPSAALLLRNNRSSRIAAPWQRRMTGFGAPALQANAAGLPSDIMWAPLPNAREELLAVARALPGASRIYAGQENLKDRLWDAAVAASPVLHLATHASLDRSDPSRSRILFSPQPGNPGSQYLFWAEVGRLNLKRTELVTLSACDTEGGLLVRGEGVQSFGRAFLAAGAASTVTTLWSVPDQPTKEFMRLFYQRLGRGDSRAQALRAAKLAFLDSETELAHPRYWAAFVLNGDGARLPPVVPWWLLAAAVMIPVAALILMRRSRKRAQR